MKMRPIQMCTNYNLISVSKNFPCKCYTNFVSLLWRNFSGGERLNKVVAQHPTRIMKTLLYLLHFSICCFWTAAVNCANKE